MSDALRVVAPVKGDATTERERAAADVDRLADEVRQRDSAIAILLERLSEAVRQWRPDEARAYAEAIDPRATAELLLARRSPIWSYFEVARNVLVFAPIAVTWFGLSTATDAYAKLLAQRPEFGDKPFLLLWEQGFQGVGNTIIFSTLAAIDASLIGLLILLSLAIHIRADVRDAGTRAVVLLKESQIRATLAHASSVAASGLGADEAEDVLDQMAAEERRVFERSIEREQQLYDLEGAIGELRRGAADLVKAAEMLRESAARNDPGQTASWDVRPKS